MKKPGQKTPPIQSLDRGLVILETVAKTGDPVPLGQLTELLGIDRSSAFRLANTLKRRGFLANPSGRKDYILGPSIWRLSRQYDWSNMLIGICDQHLKLLASKTNETAHLAVREGKQALFIDHASINHIIAVTGQTGELVPLYCTAHGKALLADFGIAELKALFGAAPLQLHTARTIVSIEQLAKACAEIRVRGFATDDGEFQEGIRCVAAPIRDKGGRIIGSLGISAPLTRFPKERYSVCAQQVSKVARQISATLSAQSQ
ncbi:MAG TPA: IclR family transcriptional regulator [Terriglobales bacterium]|nr:IclR family transcriptional regulator [Terriglobales bacterium]